MHMNFTVLLTMAEAEKNLRKTNCSTCPHTLMKIDELDRQIEGLSNRIESCSQKIFQLHRMMLKTHYDVEPLKEKFDAVLPRRWMDKTE